MSGQVSPSTGSLIPPVLPLELLVCEVVLHLDNKQAFESLRILSRTCSSLRAPCQCVLFRRISWYRYCSEARNLLHLISTTSAHLAGYIHQILFRPSNRALPDQTARDIVELLKLLPHVESLALEAPAGYERVSWTLLSPELQRSVVRLFCRKSFSHLTLKSIEDIPVSLLACSSIKSLFVSYTTIFAEPRPTTTERMHLKKLEFWAWDPAADSSLRTILQSSQEVHWIIVRCKFYLYFHRKSCSSPP